MLRTKGRIKVMMTTEGTYPFHQGGVSTWCNVLVMGQPTVDYVIFSVMMNPYVTQKFTLPGNSTLIKVPLWGTEDPSEHLTSPFSEIYLAKKRTDTKIVKSHFLALFSDMISEIISKDKNPLKFADILYELYVFFKTYDYRNSFKDELVWAAFKEQVLRFTADPKNQFAEPSVFDIIQSLGWLYRFFTIINTPLPQVDVTHSAAAAFCGIPGVLAKMENKTPFLLTEHGVYLREQYLSVNRMHYSSYLKTFLIRFIHSITQLNFAMADQVSPVCLYNTRWEQRFGVSPSKLEVIYNGVDRDIFAPSREQRLNPQPTVVTVARIDPVKDLITLIRSAAIVKDRLPEVKFLVYGSVAVPDYYEECLGLCKQLNLGETFIFAGHTNDVPAALRSGDVIALSSITEAFPYSVVEAMMAGKAVVATDVGGVREAIADCGLVVRPRQHEQMAQALITLLEDSELRHTLGEEAHKRALNLFTIERSLGLYLKSYQKLIRSTEQPQVISILLQRQKLLANKGYALLEIGYWQEAIAQFQKAVDLNPNSLAVPVLLTEIAFAYNELGESERANNDLERAKALTNINSGHRRLQYQDISSQLQRQRLHGDKGYALKEMSYWQEAIVQFRNAVKASPNSRAVPLFLTEIAFCYNELGESERAYAELAKAEILEGLIQGHLIA